MFGVQLEAIEAQLHTLTESLDPAALTGEQALTAAEAIGRCQRLLDGLRLVVAGALPDDTHFAQTPERTTAKWAARTWGCSLGEATDTITAGTHLVDLPITETALRAGLLSGPQARAVVEGATVDPGAEAALLGRARRESLYRLRQDVATVTANATNDTQRHARAHRERHLRINCRHGGTGGHLEGAGTASDTTTILRAVRARHEDLFQ